MEVNETQVRNNGICQHYDCKYFAGTHTANRCDYISITGESRLLWHRKRGLPTEVSKCQCYDSGKKERTVRQLSASINTEPPKQYTSGRLKTAGRKKDNTPTIKSRLTKADNNAINEAVKRMAAEGKTDEEIAAALKISKGAVQHRRNRLNIFYRTRHNSEKMAEKQKRWERLYKEGFGTNTIAELTGTSNHTVLIWRDAAGLPPSKCGGISKAEKQRREKIIKELGL